MSLSGRPAEPAWTGKVDQASASVATPVGGSEVSYFDGPYLRLHLLAFSPEQTRAQVDQIVAMLDLAPSARVLDLCCAAGRHAVELARRGYRVIGLDKSAALLRRAKHLADSRGIAVEWVQGDMAGIPLAGPFDAVINMFNSFGYFASDEQDQAVLRQVRALLRPGGKFLQEIPNLAAFLRTFESLRVQRLPDESLVMDEREFDWCASRLHNRVTVLDKTGDRIISSYDLRLYSPPEIIRMLEAAGFRVELCVGGLGSKGLGLDSTFLVTLSRGT